MVEVRRRIGIIDSFTIQIKIKNDLTLNQIILNFSV